MGQIMRQSAAQPAPDPSSLFAPGEVRDYTGFALRSVRRRWKLAFSIALSFTVAVAAVSRLLPRSYHVQSRIFALPAEGAPGATRGASDEPGGLAQGAVDTVVAQRNLRDLVREKNLVARFQATRGPLNRLLEKVKGAPPADRASSESAMVGYLQKKLSVQAKGQEVFIDFDWPEPQTAFEVAHSAEQSLLQSRREAELVPLERKALALEKDAEAAQRRIDSAIAAIEAATRSRRRGARSSSVRGLQAEGHFGALPDAKLAEQRLQLVARRKSIAELEDVRRKHLSDLNATYAEQKATLGPGNPALIDTQEKLKALQQQGAQIDALKAQEQQLLGAYVAAGGKEIELSADSNASWPVELREDDEAVTYGKARISMELSGLQQRLAEMSAAQVALAAARASFDDRYVVLAPAELPEKPSSRTALLLAGLVGGLLLGLFAAVASDLRGGVIRERWQADRLLALPVLAEVREP
jgi:hypothetical protein